jgi:PKD repeat protein
MRTALRFIALSLLLVLPATAAHAQPSVSPISDTIVNANDSLAVNVLALDPNGGPITLTATLPAFATLDEPTTANGIILTTVTLRPTAGDIGTHTGSVTATAGALSDTEEFQITVVAADADHPPRVTTFPAVVGIEGAHMIFDVSVTDPDGDVITSFTATNVPSGATFDTSVGQNVGAFEWTPDFTQAGIYDVIFAATSKELSDSVTTHITVLPSETVPPVVAPIDDVTMQEGDSLNIHVTASGLDLVRLTLTASLPGFGTLNAPTDTIGVDTLATTITLKPGAGDAGTYQASVTATSGNQTATEAFTITVTAPTPPPGNFETHASMIGNFNAHRKSICFRIRQTDASFDLRDVNRSSVALHWNGNTLHPSSTKLELDCDDEDEGEGEACDTLGVEHHGDDEGDHDDAAASDTTGCEVEGLRACFSTHALMDFFGDTGVTAGLNEATLEGHLNTGETFVATIGDFKHVPVGHGNGDEGDQGDKGTHGKGPLSLRVRPNPMNPRTDITFTLSQPMRVRVAIYDLAGRLIGKVYEGQLAAGPQSIAWNGSTLTGDRVASGVYFVSVEAARLRQVQRLTVLK